MKKLLLATAVAAVSLFGTQNAHAVLIGGPVPDKSFGTATYLYVGSNIAAFTLPGTGVLRLEDSAFGDSFGTANANGGQMQEIFNNNMTVGSTATINPSYSPFLLYFHSNGTFQSTPCYPAGGADCASTLFSNGTAAGARGGNDAGQADLAIYYASSTNTYAFFFDDGGPTGCVNNAGNSTSCAGPNAGPADDNDYNDLVVTYRVPEPFSLAILGSGLVGLGLVRRRKADKAAR